MLNGVFAKVKSIVTGLVGGFRTELARRDKNATGETSRSVRSDILTNVLGSTTFGSARVVAAEHWVNVGSGTPPGTPVEVSEIQRWMDARNLDLNPYATAARIRKEGSKDWREKKSNVFLDVIKRSEQQGKFSVVKEAAGDMVNILVPQLKKFRSV